MTSNLCVIGAQALGSILVADFLSGLLHWVQDRFPIPNGSIIDRIVILYAKRHHLDPDEFTRIPWISRTSTPFSILFCFLLIACILHLWSWQAALILGLFLFSGEIHLWSHRNPDENGRIITALQRMYIVQQPAHHLRHHYLEDEYYCVITNILNPILSRCNFFSKLDLALTRLRILPWSRVRQLAGKAAEA